MYKLTFEKRVWIVKQHIRGRATNDIAMAQNVSRMTVSNLIRSYREFGFDGLKDHLSGRSRTVLNDNAIVVILDLRKRFGYGACRIEQLLKLRGFGISHRQIEKVLIDHDLVVPNIKKQKSRKWVRYELPNPNDLWHTDWTHCPFTDKEFCAYIDDRTRLITSFGLFKSANAQNGIAVLLAGIAGHGLPKAIMTDHGSVYYANHPNANQEKTAFRQVLDSRGIKHVLARVNRPQTNGKIERFFLTYKTEFMTGSFTNVKDYVRHYNEERPHMSLAYKTPTQVWQELCKPIS